MASGDGENSSICISGEILKGLKKPHDCSSFPARRYASPRTPLGATMVSSEGACSAYYTYGRHLAAELVQVGGRR